MFDLERALDVCYGMEGLSDSEKVIPMSQNAMSQASGTMCGHRCFSAGSLLFPCHS